MTYTFGDTRLPKRFWDKVQIDPDTYPPMERNHP